MNAGPGMRIVQLGAHGHQVGFAVRRMLHVFAEVDKMRSAHLHRTQILRRLREERRLRAQRGVGPGLAQVVRDLKARHGAEIGVAPIETAVRIDRAGAETVGAVVPDTVMHQRPAGIAPSVRRRPAALGHGGILDLKSARIIALHHRVAGIETPCEIAARAGEYTVHRTIREGRVEMVVARPGGIDRVGNRVVAVATGEGDPTQGRRLLKGAILRDLGFPLKATVGCGLRVFAHSVPSQCGAQTSAHGPRASRRLCVSHTPNSVTGDPHAWRMRLRRRERRGPPRAIEPCPRWTEASGRGEWEEVRCLGRGSQPKRANCASSSHNSSRRGSIRVARYSSSQTGSSKPANARRASSAITSASSTILPRRR